MKFSIERDELLEVLGRVRGMVARRPTIPILGNVKLSTLAGNLMVFATDLEREAAAVGQCKVDREDTTTVPAHLLHDFVRKLPAGSQVVIEEAEPGRVVVAAGRARCTLPALPSDDFPSLEAGAPDCLFCIAPADLRFLVARTAFAMSNEETRYYLNGIYLHTTNTDSGVKLRAVATDGHRLARAEIPAPEGAADMPGIIVPRKTVLEVTRLLDSAADDITVECSESTVRFAVHGGGILSKLVAGNFPEYERVIPKNNPGCLKVDTRLFAQAVERVSIVASDKGRAVRLSIAPDTLRLSVDNPEAGSAEEALAATFNGGQMEIGFNARYLLDIAGQITGDTTVFELGDAGGPAIIRDPDEPRALFVLMPMRV